MWRAEEGLWGSAGLRPNPSWGCLGRGGSTPTSLLPPPFPGTPCHAGAGPGMAHRSPFLPRGGLDVPYTGKRTSERESLPHPPGLAVTPVPGELLARGERLGRLPCCGGDCPSCGCTRLGGLGGAQGLNVFLSSC